MNCEAKAFTAAEFSSALGVSPQRMRQLLASERAVQKRVQGQLANAWRLADLSSHTRQDLLARARARGYGSVETMLTHPQWPWKPRRRLGQHDQTLALQLRDVFAPVLRRASRSLATAALVREVREASGNISIIATASERTLRRIINAARARDRGEENWERTELYLPARFDFRSARPHRCARNFPRFHDDGLTNINEVITAAGKHPTARKLNVIWHLAFTELERGRASKRMLLEKLLTLSCFTDSTFAAIERSFDRKRGRWMSGDRNPDSLADHRKQNGRKPLATLNDTERAKLRRLRLKTGSTAMAVEILANDRDCTPEVRAAIRRPRKSRHNLPKFLRKAAYVSPEAEAKERGDRDYAHASFTNKRDDTEILRDGRRVKIAPGDWYELDDMSLNSPYWFENTDGDDELARRHAVGMGRQGLFCMDVASGKWLGVELVGRARDAYRSEDILRFLFRIFNDYGLPRRGLRLERGIWRSRNIIGQRFSADTAEEQLRFGLHELGIEIKYCRTAKQKGCIETGFGYLQRVAAATSNAPSFGRWRGERSRDCLRIQRARDGRVHPQTIGLSHIEQAAEEMRTALVFCNGQAKEGRIQKGVPDEAWHQAVKARPLPPLPENKRHLFMPIKKTIRVRAGYVETTLDRILYRFAAPELFASLGSGYPVTVCFDPSEPSLGASIFNAATGSENASGYKVGEFLGPAEHEPFAPQFCANSEYHDSGIENRKRFNRAFRSVYQSTGIFGSKTTQSSEMRDGRGNVVRLNRGRELPVLGSERREKKNAMRSEGEDLIKQAAREREEEERVEKQRLALRKKEEELFLANGGYRDSDGNVVNPWNPLWKRSKWE